MAVTAFPHLFSPIELGPLRVRNRVVMTSHTGGLPKYARHLEERAKHGVGMFVVGGAHYGVSTYSTQPGTAHLPAAAEFGALLPSPVTPEGIAFFDRQVIPNLRATAAAIQRHGAVCFGQVHHLGSGRDSDPWQPAISASESPDEQAREVPHALDEEEIDTLVQAFGHAARRVKEAGMDGVELHAAHGYLINQFLSPFTNSRADSYGGSLENRMRLLLEIFDAVRRQVGPDYPIGIRFNGDEMVQGGLAATDMAEIARRIQHQVVYVSVSGGTATGLRDGPKMPYVAPWFVELGHNVPAAAIIKEAVSVPMIVAGRINEPSFAERVLAEGKADMIGMVRALLADPEWAVKSRDGRVHEIRWCIGTNECHMFHNTPSHLVCAVNPAVSRDDEMVVTPARERKTVVVVGAGPAGMEASRVLALRGHRVLLCDKEKALGGTLRILTMDPNRRNYLDLIAYYQGALRRAGVEMLLGDAVTADAVAEIAPDAVVVATGSRPHRPEFLGTDSPHVVTATDVLLGTALVGRRVLVVGGQEDHLAPLTVAQFLAGQGKQVEVISELMMPGQRVEGRVLNLLTKRLLELGVTLTPLTEIVAVHRGAVTLANRFTKQRREQAGVDTVVLACGNRADDRLYHELKGRVPALFSIGDCRAPRRVMHAILEGARVSRAI